MATVSVPQAKRTSARAGSMPFIAQVLMMTKRYLMINLRVPAVVIPPLVISAFFLFVYEASLSGAAAFFLRGQSYLGFILPLTVISGSLSGAGVAGQNLVRDIESGYFDKLLLTPANRAALLLATMLSGAVLLVAQTIIIIVIALLMGLEPATGPLGLLALLAFSLGIGVAFSGLTVGIALLSGNAAATSSGSFLFFPLTFLTASFVPLNLLNGWIKVAATYNPITYILEATRALMNTGWEQQALINGILAIVLMMAGTFAFAAWGLVVRTKRR
jgi:ABC-2 type transport system permease protein